MTGANPSPGRLLMALLGGKTLSGVAGKLMFTAAETKDEASALYPIEEYELVNSWPLIAMKTALLRGKLL